MYYMFVSYIFSHPMFPLIYFLPVSSPPESCMGDLHQRNVAGIAEPCYNLMGGMPGMPKHLMLGENLVVDVKVMFQKCSKPRVSYNSWFYFLEYGNK